MAVLWRCSELRLLFGDHFASRLGVLCITLRKDGSGMFFTWWGMGYMVRHACLDQQSATKTLGCLTTGEPAVEDCLYICASPCIPPHP